MILERSRYDPCVLSESRSMRFFAGFVDFNVDFVGGRVVEASCHHSFSFVSDFYLLTLDETGLSWAFYWGLVVFAETVHFFKKISEIERI